MGDVAPIVALGERLARRGHTVRAAFDPGYADVARHAGLAFFPCGRESAFSIARRWPLLHDHWRVPSEGGARESEALLEGLDLAAQTRDLAAACTGADLLVATTLQAAAPLVAERDGLPWLQIALMPGRDEAGHERAAES